MNEYNQDSELGVDVLKNYIPNINTDTFYSCPSSFVCTSLTRAIRAVHEKLNSTQYSHVAVLCNIRVPSSIYSDKTKELYKHLEKVRGNLHNYQTRVVKEQWFTNTCMVCRSPGIWLPHVCELCEIKYNDTQYNEVQILNDELSIAYRRFKEGILSDFLNAYPFVAKHEAFEQILPMWVVNK